MPLSQTDFVMIRNFARAFVLRLAPLLLLAPSSLLAQLAPPSTGGVPALMRELATLGHYERVLMIGAHPDDEDTELLTILSRGMGAEAAYLSLTRGEGGQNLVGPELGDALGILRTEELLGARRIDGARQFFTRAYDFGFSKTIDDAWQHWPRDSVLKDVVRIIRRFRPQIVVSVFSGTPADGHGQHQAAGWAAKRAFEVAGDPTVFPDLEREEGLAPWTPLKLYRSARFTPAAEVVTLDGGAIDPVTGKTFRQLAMEGRSLHRSQKMGQLQPIGPSVSRVTLWEDRTGVGKGGFWAGVDTSLAAWPFVRALPAALRDSALAAVRAFTAQVGRVRGALLGPARGAELDRLARDFEGIARIRERGECAGAMAPRCGSERDGAPPGPAEFVDQWRHVQALLADGSGVLLDAVAGTDRVVPGDTLGFTVVVANTGRAPLTGVWSVVDPYASDTVAARLAVGPGQAASMPGALPVGSGASITTPYFLAQPRVGSMYTWPREALGSWGLPFAEGGPRVVATWSPERGAERVHTERDLTARVLDPASGELRRPVVVVP